MIDHQKVIQAAHRLQNMELIIICAKDIIAFWPKMTLKNLSSMTKMIDTLRQAVEHYETKQ
jgi:hypothetical protein